MATSIMGIKTPFTDEQRERIAAYYPYAVSSAKDWTQRLWRFSCVKTKESALDFAVDALVCASVNYDPNNDSGCSFGTYLINRFRFARIDWYRANGKEREIESRYESLDYSDEIHENALASRKRNEAQICENVEWMLSLTRTTQQRDILRLRYQQGLTFREVAASEGTSVAHAHIQSVRGLAEIKIRMESAA